MIQTLIVYITLTLLMVVILSAKRITTGNSELKINANELSCRRMLLVLALYAIVFGTRYYVGVDFPAYLEAYESYRLYNDLNEYWEQGFNALICLIGSLNLHYSWFFGLVAFLQLWFIFLLFKNNKQLLVFVVLIFMLGASWLLYANVLRQQLAFAIFAFSIPAIIERKPLKHYLILLLALSMHKSAILLFVLYPIFRIRKNWTPTITIQLLLLACSLLVMHINIIEQFLLSIDGMAVFVGYDGYVNAVVEGDDSMLVASRNRGVGFLLLLLIDIIVILFSKKLREYYKSPFVDCLYTLFFAGLLWNYIFNGSIILNRINGYLYGFKFIVVAMLLQYLYRNLRLQRHKAIFFALIILHLLVFAGVMMRMDENTARYVFFWQTELYSLKFR